MTKQLFKYPVTFNTNGTLGVDVSWNGSFQTVFMTVNTSSLYWFTADGNSGSQAVDLLKEFERRFHTAFSLTGSQFRVSVDGTTQTMVCSGSLPFSLRWGQPGSTHDSYMFGFTSADIHSSASATQVISGTVPVAGTWLPTRPASFDGYDIPVVSAETNVSISGRQTTVRFDDGHLFTREVEFAYEPRTNINAGYSTYPSSSLQTFYENAICKGLPFRFYGDVHAVSYLNAQGYNPYRASDPTELPWERNRGDRLIFHTVKFNMNAAVDWVP